MLYLGLYLFGCFAFVFVLIVISAYSNEEISAVALYTPLWPIVVFGLIFRFTIGSAMYYTATKIGKLLRERL